jgi:hypothetical protein
MPIRKQEIQRAKNRLTKKIENIIDNPEYQRIIKKVRDLTHIDRTRREAEIFKKKEWDRTKPKIDYSGLKIPEEWPAFKEEEPKGLDFSILLLRKMAVNIIEKSLNIEQRLIIMGAIDALKRQGIIVEENFLLYSLCHDFEGQERKEFLEYAMLSEDPLHEYYWYYPMEPVIPYKKWVKSNVMKPNRIYLDVTEASLDDVVSRWNNIEVLQKRLKTFNIKRGRPPGSESESIEERDKTIYDIYLDVKKMLQKRGKKRHITNQYGGPSRYKGVYDMVSKIYGSKLQLPENQFLPIDTVKGIIAKMGRKMKQKRS